MRLVIANDLDDWIVRKKDVRAWTQRMLWFVGEGDVVVTMSAPDAVFLEHVCAVKKIDPESVIVHEIGEGRFDGMFDHLRLRAPELIAAVARDARAASEVIAAWPSPHVAAFVDAVGLASEWAGHALFAQAACEPLNSMGGFRAFAAAAGAPISAGFVCRSQADAIDAMRFLLRDTDTVMVKKAHAGAGAGNHIVTTRTGLDVDRSGGKYISEIGEADVERFWAQHWEWASADGAYPVVVEQFQRDSRSVYAEFDCGHAGAQLSAIGELHFSHRALVRETVPVDNLPAPACRAIVNHSQRLADYYWRLGYRGPLSADAVVTPSNEVYFTEVNAQFTGSTHLYRVILGDVAGQDRQVTQVTSPDEWAIRDTSHFLGIVHRSGQMYNPATRLGVVLVTPRIGVGELGPIVFAIVHHTGASIDTVMRALDDEFDREGAAVVVA